MNLPSIKYFISAALIVVFALFNLWLPVVMYFCPMSEESLSCCAQPIEEAASLNIVNDGMNCCSKVLVVERNTTPFLKIEQSFSSIQQVLHHIGQSPFGNVHAPLYHSLEISLNAPPHTSGEPLFLLNASLLI